MNRRNLTALFLTMAFILLAWTVFHWQYKVRAADIRKGRIRDAYAIASTVTRNAGENGQFSTVFPFLEDRFRNDPGILLLGVRDSKGKLRFLKSRILPGRVEAMVRKIGLLQAAVPETPDGSLNDPRPRPSGFRYGVSLDREGKGDLLLWFDPATYARNRGLNNRRFYASAVVIILTAALFLIILGRMRPAGTGTDNEAGYTEAESEYREVDYLKNRNSLLENEIESLALYRENSLLTSSVGSVPELIEQIMNGMTKLHGQVNVRLYIDETHLTHSLQQDRSGTGSIAGKRLHHLLDVLPSLDLPRRGKCAFPLEAGRISYGLLVLQKHGEDLRYSESALHNTAQLVHQAAVALYNFIVYETAVTDALTGLFNRRHFDTRLREEYDRCRRYGSGMSLVLADIDHFKECNDTWGHQAGDQVLKGVASLIKGSIRRTDYAFRYGGEEIAIIMPETDIEQASDAMENLRARIETHRFTLPGGEKIGITCSFGVSAIDGDGGDGPAELLRLVDRALYFSKKNGRNMVSRRLALPSGENNSSRSDPLS